MAEEQSSAEDNTDSLKKWFAVESNTVISNNVFKITVKQTEQIVAQEFIVYFVSSDGNIISNKKKLSSGDAGCETVLGFVLDSGIDYTRMKKCFMKIVTVDEEIQNIEFGMNIAFYSDF